MNEQDKQVHKQEESRTSTETAAVAKPSTWKRFLAKKWVFPATYMAAAAIILTLMWVYQDAGTNDPAGESDLGLSSNYESQDSSEFTALPDSVPVNAPTETMVWPVEDRAAVEVSMPFFDSEATNEEKQAAMIQHGDTYVPSVGISLSRQDNESFNVIAAMSGTVTRVEKQLPLVGNLVEITHGDGLKTIYQSLADVTVTEGAEVKQGDVIAKAGRNELQKDLGVHLHFEVFQNDQPVNPEKLIAAAN